MFMLYCCSTVCLPMVRRYTDIEILDQPQIYVYVILLFQCVFAHDEKVYRYRNPGCAPDLCLCYIVVPVCVCPW